MIEADSMDDVMVDLDDRLVDSIAQGMAEWFSREQLIERWTSSIPAEWFARELAHDLVYLRMAREAEQDEADAEQREDDRRAEESFLRKMDRAILGHTRTYMLKGPPLVRPPENNPPLAQWREDNSFLLTDPCSYCGAPSVALDHIIPRHSGGTNTDDNVTPACNRCNSSKGKWPLLVWLARRGVRPADE